MLKIGLISDTHHYLDPAVFRHFEACDEIWHAGDFGTIEIANKLKEFRPLKGVYGNIDGQDVRSIYSRDPPMAVRRNKGVHDPYRRLSPEI
ncbi:metallophosphoesterase family protein [Puia sp. P3]|uniref:metallophosphoesterase family protein n=1 Tax=Puia sp. P3 TaxID=3423952 RepID=UPI003D667C80